MAFPSLVTSVCMAGLLVEVLDVTGEVAVVIVAVVETAVVFAGVSISCLLWSAGVDGMVTLSDKCSVTSSQSDVVKSMASLLVTVVLSVKASVSTGLLVIKEFSMIFVGPSVAV